MATFMLPFVSFINQRLLALFTTLLTFVLSLYLLTLNQLDGISLVFIILTTLLIPGALLSSWTSVKDNSTWYFGSLLLLESALLGVFTSSDILSFYVYFEASLIPLFVLLGLFGGANRKRATYLLFLYTLAGSLLLLLGLVLIVLTTGTTSFALLEISLHTGNGHLIWLLIFASLAVKTPLIPLHIWLPRAHAEAPVSGSILLAGVVLKLATFGYIRLLLQLMPLESSYWTPLVQVLSIISIIYASFSALRQVDTKAIVAISSVAHMGVVVLGLFSNSLQGIMGAIVLSLAHGLVSPALFFLVGAVLYDRYHVRIIRYYRGLFTQIPLFSLIFFLATIGNIGVPLTLNFIGELIAIIGSFERSVVVGTIAAFSVVLSAAYSLWFFARIVFGACSPYLLYASDINRRELHVLLPWLGLTFFFGIYPSPLIGLLNHSISSLLY